MIKVTKKAFTLVELLVVITILAIISVVAYQNFGGAVDKAVSGRKIQDISTIETSLQQYKADNNYYPPVALSGSTNMWGYTGSVVAKPTNTVVVTYNGEEIDTLASADGGGAVYGTGTWKKGGTNERQIGAKGTMTQGKLGKKYLTKDLYDPEIGDLKVGSLGKKMIDYGVGRYVYAVYKKNKTYGPGNGDWSSNYRGVNYNIAFTIKEDGTDTYKTKIVGDYDEESCYTDKDFCPTTLIGSGTTVLVDGDTESGSGVPYPVADF